MPFYEFVCRRCGAEFELLLAVENRDGQGESCPVCGRKELTRKISAPQIAGSHAYAGGCRESGGKFT